MKHAVRSSLRFLRVSWQGGSVLRFSLHAMLALPAVILLLWSVIDLLAQEPVFKSDVKVVNVLATVRDRHGQIARNLTKDDFILEEDGQPQTITYFATESDLPLTLGLLVDVSMSQARLLGEERDASYAFIDQVLREDRDKAFIIQFENEAELLEDLTSSRQRLQAALRALRTPEPVRWGGIQLPGSYPGGWPVGIPGPFPGGGAGRQRRPSVMRSGGGTALYDAVFLASDELMRKQSGRKAIVVLTDGVDNASRVSLERAIESAQRADTLVYAILYSDPSAYSGGTWGRRGPVIMQPGSTQNGGMVVSKMTRETGGRMFEVSGSRSIGEIYQTLQEELRNQYNIGYTPRSETKRGFHKITLRTKQRDLVVQSRAGYYSD